MRHNEELSSPEVDNPFQLSESPSRKTIYMLDVPKRKFSDADDFLMRFSVEESLPASLPLSSPSSMTPPINGRHGYRGLSDGISAMTNSNSGTVLYSNNADMISHHINELSIVPEETIEKND